MEKISNFIINTLELPPEIMSDISIITLIGTHKLRIENFTGLYSFSDTYAVISAFKQRIFVQGEMLQISSICHGEIVLSGRIQKISLEEVYV